MPETPKEKPLFDSAEPNESAIEDSWEDDQKKRGYYYDDAHGYEEYDPGNDREDDDDEFED